MPPARIGTNLENGPASGMLDAPQDSKLAAGKRRSGDPTLYATDLSKRNDKGLMTEATLRGSEFLAVTQMGDSLLQISVSPCQR